MADVIRLSELSNFVLDVTSSLFFSQCRCCPRNCAVGSWGSWGACNAACERTGTRTRSRRIITSPSCGGTGCPSTSSSKACSGPCCPRNCVLSSWTAWSKCSSRKSHSFLCLFNNLIYPSLVKKSTMDLLEVLGLEIGSKLLLFTSIYLIY